MPPGGAPTSGANFPIETGGPTPASKSRRPRVKMLANGPGSGGFQGRHTTGRQFRDGPESIRTPRKISPRRSGRFWLPPGGRLDVGGRFCNRNRGANPCSEPRGPRVKMLANGPGKGWFPGPPYHGPPVLRRPRKYPHPSENRPLQVRKPLGAPRGGLRRRRPIFQSKQGGQPLLPTPAGPG